MSEPFERSRAPQLVGTLLRAKPVAVISWLGPSLQGA